MYAVIETGGKQYRVELGTELEVERLDVEAGESVTLDRVLLVADGDEAAIGRPLVENAAVEAEVVRQERGEKLIVFKYRPKARRRVKKGHRQHLTLLRVTDVRLDGKSAADDARKVERDKRTERQRLDEAAARQAAEDAKLAAKLAQTAKAKPEKADEAPPKGRTRRSKAEAPPEAQPQAASEPGAVAPKRTRAKATPAAERAEVDAAADATATKADTTPATKADTTPATKADTTEPEATADAGPDAHAAPDAAAKAPADGPSGAPTDESAGSAAPKRPRAKKSE